MLFSKNLIKESKQKSILFSIKISSSTTGFNIENNQKKPNQNIKIISKALCDTENWSNGC